MASKSPLNNDDKLEFARLVHQDRLANPSKAWVRLIISAREHFPEEKRPGPTILHPTQIPWLIPILESLEKGDEPAPPKFTQGNSKLTEEDRRNYAQSVYDQNKTDPNKSWVQILIDANSVLPKEKHLKLHSLRQSGWLQEYVADCEKADKAKTSTAPRPAINGRQHLQTSMETHAEKPKHKKVKSKVFLEHEEKLIFATQVYLLQKQFPGIEWKYVLKKANEYLPEDRRVGAFQSAKAIGWLEKYKAMAEKQLAEEAAKPVIAEPVSAPVAPVAQNPSLVDILAKMFEPMVAEALQKAAMNAGIVPSAAPVAPAPEVLKGKEKVLIVGVQPNQGQEIQKEFGRHFDFKIFDSNVTAEKIKANIAFTDHAILMTRFVSHSTQSAMRGHPGFIFCNGTVVALKDQLARLIKH